MSTAPDARLGQEGSVKQGLDIPALEAPNDLEPRTVTLEVDWTLPASATRVAVAGPGEPGTGKIPAIPRRLAERQDTLAAREEAPMIVPEWNDRRDQGQRSIRYRCERRDLQQKCRAKPE